MQDRDSLHLLLASISHLPVGTGSSIPVILECQNPLCSIHRELEFMSFLQPKWFVKDTFTVNSQEKTELTV